MSTTGIDHYYVETHDWGKAVAFWQRFAAFNQQQGAQTPAFLRTHPTDPTRIHHLQEWMPNAKAQYHPAP
jgi:predicted Zn-dependent protease